MFLTQRGNYKYPEGFLLLLKKHTRRGEIEVPRGDLFLGEETPPRGEIKEFMHRGRNGGRSGGSHWEGDSKQFTALIRATSKGYILEGLVCKRVGAVCLVYRGEMLIVRGGVNNL